MHSQPAMPLGTSRPGVIEQISSNNAGTARRGRRVVAKVNVRLFAIVRQHVGQSSVSLDLPDHATVADLKSSLASAYPSLEPLLPNLMISVNSQYAADESTIPPHADLAAIPPVSGGSGTSEFCHD